MRPRGLVAFAIVLGGALAGVGAPGAALARPAPRGRLLHPASRGSVRSPGTSAQRRGAAAPYPSVELFAVNLDESLRWRPYDERGRARGDATRALQRLLRCRQTGAQHRVDPRLARALYQVARHFHGRRVEVFSGYRPRAYCTLRHSRHLTASALDFRVPGVRNEALVRWLRATFHPAGVGYYPNGIHVHLDLARSHDAYWVDESEPGGRAAPARDTAPGGADAAGEASPDELPPLRWRPEVPPPEIDGPELDGPQRPRPPAATPLDGTAEDPHFID
jgi:uncharacterized protein YcbK (DUF882 family)